MKKIQIAFKSHCPINFSQEIFGDRWSLLIVRDLMFKGKTSYGEFLRSDERISTNILAARLDKLEFHGIISKHEDDTHGSKFKYALTPKGIDLIPLLLEMIRWGAKYDEDTLAPEEFIKRLEENPKALALQIKTDLESG